MAFDADRYDPDAPIVPTAVTFTQGKARAGHPAKEITLERFAPEQAAPLIMQAAAIRTFVTDLNIYPRATPNANGEYFNRRTKKRMGHMSYVAEDKHGEPLAAFHGLPTTHEGVPTNFGKKLHLIKPWIISQESNLQRDAAGHDFGTEEVDAYALPADLREKAFGAQGLGTMCGAMDRAGLGYGTGAMAIASEGLEIIIDVAMQMPGIRNIRNVVQPITNIATREMTGFKHMCLKQFAHIVNMAGFNAIVEPDDPYANSNSFFVESMRALSGRDPNLTFMKRVMHDTAVYMENNNFAAPGSELDVARIIMVNRIADGMGAYAISDTVDEFLGKGTTERIGNVAATAAAIGLAAQHPQFGPTMRHMLDVVQNYATNPWISSEPLQRFADGSLQPVIAKAAGTPQARITVLAGLAMMLGATIAASEDEMGRGPQSSKRRPATVPNHGIAAANSIADDVA